MLTHDWAGEKVDEIPITNRHIPVMLETVYFRLYGSGTFLTTNRKPIKGFIDANISLSIFFSQRGWVVSFVGVGENVASTFICAPSETLSFNPIHYIIWYPSIQAIICICCEYHCDVFEFYCYWED